MNRHSVPNATLGLPGKPPNGGSKPRFYEFDDGVTRLVKWSPSPHGTKACFNELVASRLGQLIDAPILRGIVVYVPDEIIPDDHRTEGAKPGFHFAVTRMLGENFIAPGHYEDIENSSELPAAAVLLSWLAVGDHQGHNQYLQRLEREESGVIKKTKRFRLIDMGQMFGDFNWSAGSVAKVHTSYKLPGHLANHLTKATLATAIDQLAQLPDSIIEECFQDCPGAWGISNAHGRIPVAREFGGQVARLKSRSLDRNSPCDKGRNAKRAGCQRPRIECVLYEQSGPQKGRNASNGAHSRAVAKHRFPCSWQNAGRFRLSRRAGGNSVGPLIGQCVHQRDAPDKLVLNTNQVPGGGGVGAFISDDDGVRCALRMRHSASRRS
jgi:hypothetical protein